MKPQSVTTGQWLQYNMLFSFEHLLGKDLYKKLFLKTEKKLFSKIDQHIKTFPIPERQVVIEYADGVCNEALLDPFKVKVFRGAAKDWPCVNKWSLDFFVDKYGDNEVPFYNTPGLFPKDTKKNEIVTVRKFIEELKLGSKRYLKFSPVINSDSTLRKDFDDQWLKRAHSLSTFAEKYYLFIGGKGTTTPIHTAITNTAFIQVVGQKRWYFWEPSDRMFLGVRSERHPFYFSHANPLGESNEEFPLLSHARRHEVILNPGDILWFPSYFLHDVENLSDSIGVAYKIAHFPSAFKSSTVLTFFNFLATKPSLIETFFKTRFKNVERNLFALSDY